MTVFLTPPIQKGKAPPFHEMGALPFQELCRDLLEAQSEVVDCRVYGDNGEAQFGIDIRCERKTHVLEVAQAKCYERFLPSDIAKASDKFMEHLELWTTKGVRKFILIVSCRVSSVKAIKQADIEKNKFSACGIEYELWDAIKIRDILRKNDGLINTHIENAEFWKSQICGNVPTSPYGSQPNFGVNFINESLVATVNNLSSVINSKVSKELEDQRTQWREGNRKPVIEWIAGVKRNTEEWSAISSELRANIIRLEAVVNIDYLENYQTASELLDEAKEIDPDGFDFRIRANIAFHLHGPQAGLEIMGDKQDIDSLCTRASFYLQLSQPTEAISLLADSEDSRNVEVHRLLALGFLANNNLAKAVEQIQKAKLINERLESVQIADAIISYFSSLSPAVVLKNIFGWPVPIELDLIKSSNDDISALENAAATFLKISKSEYQTEANRLSLCVWRAACLAVDFRKQKEAEQQFGSLLYKYPTDHRIIAWVVSKKFSVNLQKSQSELKKLIRKGIATTADIISSVMISIHTRRTRNTLFLLEKSKQVFIQEYCEHLWDHWCVETLIMDNRLEEAKKRLTESAFHAELESLMLLLLDHESRVSGNDQPFIDFILNSQQQENHSLYLMELCKHYASKQKWRQITEYGEKLVSDIQTNAALGLSVFALYNIGEFQECKIFINKHRSMCYCNKLPDELELVYIRCMALTGQFSEALSNLRQITEINPTTQNLILLRDFYIQKGDQSGVKYVSTLAVQKNANIRPDDLISFANSTLWASRELAEELWRLAPTDKLSPQMLAQKMLLGIALGLDYELKDLSALLPHIVGKQGVPLKQVTQEEAIEIITNQNRQKNELFHIYSSGEIPIHVLAKNSGFNLFAFYENIVRHNGDTLITANQKFPLYVRYGGRPLLTDFREPDLPIEIGKLTLDVTSLLLLDRFSLLDALEGAEEFVQIPSGMVLSLVQMKDDLERYQPEIVRACKLVSDYLSEEKIKVIENEAGISNITDLQKNWVLSFVTRLKDRKGFVVGFGSQLNDWNLLDKEKGSLKFSTCADIVENLRSNGGISEGEKLTGMERLGNDGQIKINSTIPIGSNLFFIANTITQIAQTGLLSQICNYYSVWIEYNELLSIRVSIKEERDRDGFTSKLQALIERISRGLDEKRYVFLPYSVSEESIKDEIQSDFFMQNLMENINVNQKAGSSSVVDDLVIQKTLHVRGAPIYGIYEIAWLLYKRGIISEARYYETLNDFRKADLRYIPISSDEILFHLRQSPIENQRLKENTKLKVLRSSFAASLLFGRKPQIPSPPFNGIESQGEFEYLLSLVHSITYAIIEIWKDSLSEEQKIIQSTWIMDNLFLDFLTLCETVDWKREAKDRLFLVSLSLSSFFLHGLQLENDNSDTPYRRKYFEWIYYTVCEPRFRANPDLAQLTAEHIKKTLSAQISNEKETALGQIMRVLCERLYRDLPNPIKILLEQDKEFLKNIGVEIITVIQISGIQFPSRRFWNQLSAVVAGQPQVIQSVQPKFDILFSPLTSKEAFGGVFVHPETQQEITFKSADFTFLINEDYETWIDENAGSFSELSRQELREQARRISSRKEPSDRLELLDKFRKSSIGNIYEDFEEELIDTQTLNFNHLLPSLENLASFCRLKNNRKKTTKVSELISRGAKDLRNNLGLFSAISRFSSFPVEMPSFLLEEIRNLTSDERNTLFAELFQNLITPMSRAHLIKILTEYPSEEEKTTKLINSFFGTETKDEINAFLQLLSWVTDGLDGQSGSESWSTEVKLLLAWGHSNQIFGIFKRSSMPLNWLYAILKEKRDSMPFRYFLSAQPLSWKDAAFGGNLDWLSFKILSLNYALQGSNKLPEELQDTLLAEIFPWNENLLFPVLDLLKDRSIYSNQLSSFWGDDLSEALKQLLAKEIDRISILNKSSLRDLATSSIDWLANSTSTPASSVTGWQLLLGIYHNQVLPDSLLKLFEEAVLDFDFEVLTRENPTIGFLCLFFSACQSDHLSGDTQNYLGNQIRIMAKVGATVNYETENQGRAIRKDEIIAILLESSIRLSIAKGGDKMLETFSDMVVEIVTNWTEVKVTALHLLNRLIKEIPIPQAQKLGKVLLYLRSEC